MDRSTKLRLALGFAAILLVAGLGFYRSAWRGQIDDKLFPVLVAKRDLPAGTKIDVATMFETRRLPGSKMLTVLNDPAQLQGRILTRQLDANSPVTERDFVKVEPLPPDVGHEAVEVRAHLEAWGILLPGARVDLVFCEASSKDEPNRVAKVLEANLKVLGVYYPPEQTGPVPANLYTLMVMPEQKERILQAHERGTFVIAPCPERPGNEPD